MKIYRPTNRMERTNPNTRNFGLRSRDMDSAAKHSLIEKHNAKQIGYKTVADQHSRFKQFSQFLKEEHGIKDMRKIDKEHVAAYAERLNERYENNEISAKTTHDYLSAVNSVLEQAVGNSSLKITGKDAGLPTRTEIATVNKSINDQQHKQVLSQLPERLSSMAELQRELGLRFQESCKSNPQQMLKEASSNKVVTVSYGTKGGQARQVPISSPKQIEALERAAAIQGHHYSMIPKSLSYAQFQSAAYKEYAKIGFRAHSERHAYAHQRYSTHLERQTNVSGLQCPVVVGVKHGLEHFKYLAEKIGCSVEQAKAFDYQARMCVAEELGHHRIGITNNYLG